MTVATAGQLELIPLDKIKVHPKNPRQHVGDIDDLAGSIKEFGVLQPIVVVKQNGGYLNVMGSRRAAAAKRAGLKEIPARVMELSEAQAAAAALIENLHRKDLDPLEEAQGYSDYLDLTGETQKQLAEKVGRAPSTIANALRLLKAPKSIRDALVSGFLTPAHVRVLLSVKDDSLLAKVNLERGFRTADGKKAAASVDELSYAVKELNEQWERSGPPAIARAKEKLEFAQKNNKGYTITWAKAEAGHHYGRVDLIKALGEPPAKIRAELWRGNAAKHDKVCKCRAFELEQDYDGSFEIKRTCIDVEGAKAIEKAGDGYREHTYSSNDQYSRPTTKAGKAAYVRKRVDGHLAVSGTLGWGRRKPAVDAYKKLTSGGWSADRVARLVAYALTVDRCTKVGAEQLELYQRIQKMSASKARALVLEHAAAIVNGEVLASTDGGTRLAARVEVMRGFGIPVGPKIAEQADQVIAKMSLAPKKAKR